MTPQGVPNNISSGKLGKLYLLVGTRDVQTQSAHAQPARAMPAHAMPARAQSMPNPARDRAQSVPNPARA
jgi:hypothetical protein